MRQEDKIRANIEKLAKQVEEPFWELLQPEISQLIKMIKTADMKFINRDDYPDVVYMAIDGEGNLTDYGWKSKLVKTQKYIKEEEND